MLLSTINQGISQFFNSNTMDEPQESNGNYGFYASVISGTLIGGYLACKLLSQSSLLNPIISLKNRIFGINKEVLVKAIEQGDFSTVEKCLKAGIDVNSINNDGETLLHIAIKKNQNNIVNLLLDSNASINACDNNGKTPLHLAIEYNPYYVEVLINHGADVNSIDRDGQAPLHLALKYYPSHVALLINKGANVNILGRDDRTMLLFAFCCSSR